MSQPKAFGSFILRRGIVFRTSAYIQWGRSGKSLGALLLLHPESIEFAQMSDSLASRLKNNGAAMGAIHTSATMDQLIRFVEHVYSGRSGLEGKLHIYCLFQKTGANDEQVIAAFESLAETGSVPITQSLVTVDELRTHPWLLIGWGTAFNKQWKHLAAIKSKWLDQIRKSGIPTFGIMNRNGDYDHPCPPIASERPIILRELIRIFNKTVRPLLPPEKADRSRYTVIRKNSKEGDQFIVRDNENGTQALIAENFTEHPVWFHYDLAADPAVADWTSCEEPIDDLKEIVRC